MGVFSKGRGIKRADLCETGVPCIRYGELYTQYENYVAKPVSRIPQHVADNAWPIRKGDLLLAGSGETADEIGICVAYVGDEPAYAGGDIIVLRALGQDAVYLAHLLNAPVATNQKARMAQGNAVVHIRSDHLARVQLSLPPLPEQRAIAAVLSDVDELIGSLEALIAKKRAIKRAAMQELLTRRTRLPGFGGEWETAELGEFVRICPRKISPADVSDDTPCVELEHIGQAEGRLTSLGAAGRTSSIKYRFKPRDILFGRLRPYLRKWWHADRSGVCSTEIWPLTVERERAASGFVYALVQTDRFLEAAKTSYGTHMPRADWNVVSGIEFPLPPLPEQRAIATVLSDMDAEIAALDHRLDKTRAIKQGMMQQLLTGSIRLPIPDDHTEDDDSHDA